ncbi:MAG: LacI family DNA-binding transcriptional regulator [Verrucomicrobiota bacterium]|nr:LacI family DNA-binding transcriptional regulator [Verrucomicrobiota bacterium]
MNLQFIAEKADVSIATVSRVVNNRPGVSQEKVDRVKAAIKELDFVPKTRVARSIPSLAPKGFKYGNVAVLVCGEGATIGAAELLVRQLIPICHGLAQNGISPVVCMGDGPLEEMPPVVRQKMVDGVLLFGELDESLRKFFDGIPMFWMTSHHEGAKSFVLHGNREIGELAAEYCREKECRKVVVVGTQLESEVCRSRCDAFIESTGRFSLESHLLMGEKLSGIESSIADVVERNEDLFREADGIFFPSDRLAAYAYPALHRAGVFGGDGKKVVLSCGGEKNYLSGLDPRPVSIDIGADLLGRQAVEQILWRIRYPEEKRQFSVVIHPELME